MLAALGFITVILMLILIMTKKASPLVALIAVPVVTGIIACFFISVVPEGAPREPKASLTSSPTSRAWAR